MSLSHLLITDPDQFINELQKKPNFLSRAVAEQLDREDPLGYTSDMFEIDKLIPFAGHSLGPAFKPTQNKIDKTIELQKKLHAGHRIWFDCDRKEKPLKHAQHILGFKEMHEFNFTANGLSQNLGMLMDTFYWPGKKGWQSGKSKIVMLEGDFFSDQALASSVMKRAIKRAEEDECFNDMQAPTPENEIIKIKADRNGLYRTEDIIETIKQNADKIQMLCLSEIVFNTGQRLELDKIFLALDDIIKKNNIKVILDLAHTVGNRPIDLESMPVTAAVGCAYKHLSAYAGSGFGIYVSRHANLKDYPPIQGWKAADSKQVFEKINTYDASIMTHQSGATAFRTSNPPPLALLPVQTFISKFGKIGFDKCFNKSECLTRYLIMQLQHHLGDKIEIITPLDPKQRGAMIAIRVKEGESAAIIEEKLKIAGFEVDSRPPDILRMTAHYGYTKFADINRFVTSLKKVLDNKLEDKEAFSRKKWNFMAVAGFGLAALGLFVASKSSVNLNTDISASKLSIK